MKAILQRCLNAIVAVDDEIIGECSRGFVILLCVVKGDETTDAELLADKITKLRVFDDAGGKLNLSVKDVDGGALVISNFTLAADYRKGNRPDYFASEVPERARELYEYFVACLRDKGLHVETGRFGAEMKVTFTNDGPVTIDMDSAVLKK